MIRDLYFSYISLNHPDRKVRSEDIDAQVLRQLFLRIISRALLFCYAFLIFKPALPYVKDKLAHTFWQEQHMLTVHIENGKEHVHYELRKAVEETENNRPGDHKQKTEVSQDVCIIPAGPEQIIPIAMIYKQDYPDKILLFTLYDIDQDERPPQA